MKAEISLASVPAPGRENEDHAAVAPSVVVVVDGVGLPTGGCHHGVSWYARHLAADTLAALTSEAVPLPDALARGIETVAARHGGCDLTDPATPSAAVGILRFGVDGVDALSLADVTVTIDTGDEIRTVLDGHSAARAGIVSEALAGRRIGTPEHAAAVADLLADRATAVDHEFWVAAADPTVAHRATVVTLPAAHRAAVCTDGASWPVDAGVWTWLEYLDLLDALGPAQVLESVRELENADPDGMAHPRIKRHDDATVAFVRVRP